MSFLKKWMFAAVLGLGLLTGAQVTLAAEGGISLDRAPGRTTDLPSLQRGAKLFVNYCLNCHSAAFMRYVRLQDLGLSEDDIKDNLIFTSSQIGQTMKVALDPAEGARWFGTNPPDLTVIARSRSGSGGSGADYIYTLFRNYYRDTLSGTGWNNMLFPRIAMPHPLWELQGERKPVFETRTEHGEEHQVFTGQWEQVTPGTLTPLEYDQAVGDLVNYLDWMGEPARNERIQIGVWVLLFLALFTLLAWRLNAAYWKDIK